VGRDRFLPLELGKDGLCQLLTQLNAHLVEGADVPDDALGEDLVFVEGDERAEGLWV